MTVVHLSRHQEDDDRPDELEANPFYDRPAEAPTPAPDDAEQPHSWTPIDLIALALDPPPAATICGIVYPGRRHLFSGEPEALKSWAALVICADQIRAGENVMYVDFEMGRSETLSRLQAVGLTDTQIHAQLVYLEPDESFEDALIRQDTDQLLQHVTPSVVFIDAFTGALQTHNLDPHKGVDIERFYRHVVDPLRAHGAAVVILDHLAKDPATRGRFAIGSERKVGAAEVHLGFEVIVPFGRGRTGRAKITTHKDRPGHLPRPRAAELELASHGDGLVHWTLTAGETAAPGQTFRPTHLMEKISRYLETRGTPASTNEIEDNVTGNAKALRTAIATLETERYATVTDGPRNAHIYSLQRIYREEEDTTSSTSSDLVLTSSRRTDETTSSTSSTPPLGGGGGRGRDPQDEHPKTLTSSNPDQDLFGNPPAEPLDPDLDITP